MAFSKIEGRGCDEFPRYCIQAYQNGGDVWLTTTGVHPVSLQFAMAPEQARYLAAELTRLADIAEAAAAQVAA